MRSTKSKENITPKNNSITKKPGHSFVDTETAVTLKENISILWKIYKIDPAYQNIFIESLSPLPTKILIQLLAKEIENLKNGKSNVQQIDIAIHNRENSIKEIKELLNSIQKNESNADLKNQVMKKNIIGYNDIKAIENGIIASR